MELVEAVFFNTKSASDAIVTTVEAVLFDETRSNSKAFTPALAVAVPFVTAFVLMVASAPAPAARVPRFHVTTLPFVLALPWVSAVETNFTAAGNESVTTMDVAGHGPELVMAMV